MLSSFILTNIIILVIIFLVFGVILFLVLSRGRQKYHYIFAALIVLLLTSGVSFLLCLTRNSHFNEMIIYTRINIAVVFLQVPLIYHFACSYLKQPRKKSLIFIWACAISIIVFGPPGLRSGTLEIVSYDWGNLCVFPAGGTGYILSLIGGGIFFSFILLACWFLFQARRWETSIVARRHMLYILISLLISYILHLTWLIIPTSPGSLIFHTIRGLIGVAYGAVIAIAIIKHKLFDITFFIKKTTIYSAFVALIIFVFSFSEHMLATYVGEKFGEHSIFIHLISIAVVIAILMPVRQKVERSIERFFNKRKVEF